MGYAIQETILNRMKDYFTVHACSGLRGGPNFVSLRVSVGAILYMLLNGRCCQMRLTVPTARQVEYAKGGKSKRITPLS